MWIIQPTQELVKATVGIDLGSTGGSSLARGVKERMTQCGLSDPVSYLDRLRSSPTEMDELVELVVVPETWFYRDEKPFSYLQKYVLEEWLPANPAGPLNILSLPCSTGEEPYTIAMALLDIGMDPERLRIEAFDISRHALDKARLAVYQGNSFRSRDLGFRDRHFHWTDAGLALNDNVRRSVAFAQGNLLNPGFARGKGPYDAVFFRNLMIYMATAQQDESMSVIDGLLSPAGILFVGHAESMQPIKRGYAPIPYPYGFAYRKRHGGGPPPWGIQPKREAAAIARCPAPSPPRMGCEPPGPPKAKANPLALAFELADQGKTDEARRLCEAVLETTPPQPDAYYLLGLLLEAQGHPAEAESSLHKAVYLNPQHAGALAHLALAAELRGDAQAAELFRLRARRAESGQERGRHANKRR